MEEKLKSFLKTPAAGKIKIKTNAVIQRTEISPSDIVRIRRAKSYSIPEYEACCELEAGGQIIAYGKILKKKNGYYFKVIKIK